MDRPVKMHDIFKRATSPIEYSREYAQNLTAYLDLLDWRAIADVIECFWAARSEGKTIYFVGNGGSAATASHFANDLVKGARVEGRTAFRALSLTDNVPLMTALANDDGYETVFTGQMRDLFNKGDVLVAISASGNSPNVVAAAKLAKERGGRTVGFLGFDGGALRQLCDIVVHVQSEKGEYGPVEDIHMVLDHLIMSYLSMRLQGEGQ